MKPNIPVKHFFMLRHGESQANAKKIYAGQMDSPLSDQGRKEAILVAGIISALVTKPDIIIHSHLSRARDTATPIGRELKLEMIEDLQWAEQHFGDWQGVAHEEVLHLRNAGIQPPNGETDDVFQKRIIDAILKTLSNYPRPLIVCHGGCFRAFGESYGLPKIRVKNTTLYEFVPHDANAPFPWRVYRYDRETGKKELDDHFTVEQVNMTTTCARRRYPHE